MKRFYAFSIFVIFILLWGQLSIVSAAAPANDSWMNSQTIAALPFTDSQFSVEQATSEVVDPFLLCNERALAAGGSESGFHTLWYQFTTGSTPEFYNLSTAGSNYDTVVAVFTGAPDYFRMVTGGCNDSGNPDGTSAINGLYLAADTTYTIVIASALPLSAATVSNFSMSLAPVYTVTKTSDTSDGTCDGDCTLREAINASNATPGVIILPANDFKSNNVGSSEDLNITGDLDIQLGMSFYGSGIGQTMIDGNLTDRTLDIDPLNSAGITVIFQNLTIQAGSFSSGKGGGLRNADANDFIAMEAVEVKNNLGNSGGGLWIGGRAQLRALTVASNTAVTRGGGLFFGGDATVVAELEASVVHTNAANGNNSNDGGGGITTTSQLRMSNVTISNNRSNNYGGGLYIATLSGIPGKLDMRNSTIAGNVADYDNNYAGTERLSGGVLFKSAVSQKLYGNIIANNIGNAGGNGGNDCSLLIAGVTFETDYNHVESNGGQGNCAFNGTNDVTGTDPMLNATLANNGGTTLTHALLANSPAIDSGGTCLDALGRKLYFDQRLYSRTGEGGVGSADYQCDKGAYEYLATVPPLGAPGALTATGFNIDTVTLNWIDNVVGETVFVGEYSADGIFWLSGAGSGADTTTMNISGLGCNYYYFRVFGETTGGVSLYSNFTKGAPVCALPTPTPTSPPPTATFTLTPVPPTATFTPLPAGSVELFTNGDFEIDLNNDNTPDTWTVVAKSEDKLKCNTLEKEFSLTGACAFRFIGSQTENSRLSQNPPINAYNFVTGDMLTLQFYYRTNDFTPRLKIKLIAFYYDSTLDDDGVEKMVVTIKSPQTTYQLYTVLPVILDGDVAKIKAQFQNRALGGKIYIDAASLVFTALDGSIP